MIDDGGDRVRQVAQPPSYPSLLSHAMHIPSRFPSRCPAFLAHHCMPWIWMGVSLFVRMYLFSHWLQRPPNLYPSRESPETRIHLSSLVVPICDFTFRSSVFPPISCCHVNVTSFLCFLFCPCARMFVVHWLSPQPGSVDPDELLNYCLLFGAKFQIQNQLSNQKSWGEMLNPTSFTS